MPADADLSSSAVADSAIARRISQRSTEDTLRDVLARVAARPDELDAILGAYAEPLVAFTTERVVVAANPSAEVLFGYESHGLDSRRTDDLLPPRLRQPAAPPMAVTSDLMSVDLPGVRRNGEERPLSWTLGSVAGSAQPIFVMLLRDRDQIDDALEALRASEERFRLLVDGVRDHAIFMLDVHGKVSTWNAGAERIKGWSASEIIGQPYEAFFTAGDRAAGVPAKYLAAAASGGGHDVSGWRVRKDGTRFYAEAFLSPLRARDGELRGFAKVTHDLTSRMVAEENERRLVIERAAREAAEAAEGRARLGEDRLVRLYRMALALAKATTPDEVAAATLMGCLSELDAAGGAVYVLDRDGKTLVSLGQSGHPAGALDEYETMPLEARTPLGDAARSGEAGFYASYEACAQAYPDLRDVMRAGDFEASVALPLRAHGHPLGVLGIRYSGPRVFEDAVRSLLLTIGELCSQALERAQLLVAEQKARTDAETASRAKDEFLAMLGHELRNPLAPISTALQLMKLRQDDSSSRERAVIERQVRHLTRLVDDLLDVSRIARGLVELSRRPVEIADVLSNAVEIASPLLEQRSQHLSVHAAPGLSVDADPTRLSQVVSNLLTNAAKFTPPHGHIELSAELEGEDVVLRVRDDGEGMTADLLPTVFDLFIQGKRTLARSEGGLGLGLALVKNLVALHGGTTSASSDGPGKGSEFVVRIPAMTPARSATPVAARSTPRALGGGRRVLLVDDNEDALDMLAYALRELGYEVEVAVDAQGALERLKEFHADVAVLDLGLPVVDGFELARLIRGDSAKSALRLVALTGYGQTHDVAKSREAGFDVHLVKPVAISAVVAALES
jgi:PAS domain S-box-containing protein